MCVQTNRKAHTQAIILTVVIEILNDCSTLQVLAGSQACDRMGGIFKMITVQETDTVIATFLTPKTLQLLQRVRRTAGMQ